MHPPGPPLPFHHIRLHHRLHHRRSSIRRGHACPPISAAGISAICVAEAKATAGLSRRAVRCGPTAEVKATAGLSRRAARSTQIRSCTNVKARWTTRDKKSCDYRLWL
jgi:hypothetical protein